MNREIGGGRYRLTNLLGEGAFSRVYLAEDPQGRRYACKISEKTEMLAREAGYQKELRHPLFPAFVEYGEAADGGWLIMEYIRGETLESVLRREKSLPRKRAAEIGLALAGGLRKLQERAVPLLFRDLKPANVLLEEGGRVRLLDLGCVCPAGYPQSAAGTPGFGAPEQFTAGSRQDITVDLYGLGRLLLAMTGGDGRRDREAREARGARGARGVQEGGKAQEPEEVQKPEEARKARGVRETRGAKEAGETKEIKEIKVAKETRGVKGIRETLGFYSPLGKVIEKCTRELPEERLPDMRTVEGLLAVCSGTAGGGRFDEVQRAYLEGKIQVRKNVVIR
ncbi:MAG: protein kinase [Roseburia sp.]|nr:protein kinase [Roseburia sp.]MCM1097187.1 protein kinase [Ruminococcus flavefaciens]